MSAGKTTMTGFVGRAGASLGLAVTLGVIAPPVLAQGDSGWSNQGLIYLLGPALDGTSGVGPFDTDVDLSAGDVFDNLDSAFLGMYRGEGERWGGPPRRRVYGSKRRHRGYVRGLFR